MSSITTSGSPSTTLRGVYTTPSLFETNTLLQLADLSVSELEDACYEARDAFVAADRLAIAEGEAKDKALREKESLSETCRRLEDTCKRLNREKRSQISPASMEENSKLQIQLKEITDKYNALLEENQFLAETIAQQGTKALKQSELNYAIVCAIFEKQSEMPHEMVFVPPKDNQNNGQTEFKWPSFQPPHVKQEIEDPE
ncbi:MAG: hypothetical protein Q9180_008140, partial [Flavoplaca navasiana]